MERRSDKVKELREFRQQLLSQFKLDKDDISVWKIKDLGIQTATQALQAADGLTVLRELISDFPIWAGSLGRKRVSQAIQVCIGE
jgi:hypothetical protein